MAKGSSSDAHGAVLELVGGSGFLRWNEAGGRLALVSRAAHAGVSKGVHSIALFWTDEGDLGRAHTSFPHLRELWLQPLSASALRGLDLFQRLASITVLPGKLTDAELAAAQFPASLRSATFRESEGLRTAAALAGLPPGLTRLRVHECGAFGAGAAIRDLAALPFAPALQALSLRGCSAVCSLDGIEGFAALRELDVRRLVSLESLQPAAALPALQAVSSFRCAADAGGLPAHVRVAAEEAEEDLARPAFIYQLGDEATEASPVAGSRVGALPAMYLREHAPPPYVCLRSKGEEEEGGDGDGDEEEGDGDDDNDDDEEDDEEENTRFEKWPRARTAVFQINMRDAPEGLRQLLRINTGLVQFFFGSYDDYGDSLIRRIPERDFGKLGVCAQPDDAEEVEPRLIADWLVVADYPEDDEDRHISGRDKLGGFGNWAQWNPTTTEEGFVLLDMCGDAEEDAPALLNERLADGGNGQILPADFFAAPLSSAFRDAEFHYSGG